MKKPDEHKLWKLFRESVEDVNYDGTIDVYNRIIASGIPMKRGYYLVDKWVGQDLVEYGVSLNWVWLTDKGMKTEFLVEAEQ